MGMTGLRRRVECRCGVCGKAFTLARSQVAAGQGRYCSRACLALSKRKYDRPPELPCRRCGTPFKTVGRPDPTYYCSKACADESKRIVRPTSTCAQCDRDFPSTA